jgi:hypothetical protein
VLLIIPFRPAFDQSCRSLPRLPQRVAVVVRAM